MLVELNRNEHQEAKHLIDSYTNIEAAAVIIGQSAGWVFVDSRISPRVALVWSKGMEGFYLLGDEENLVLHQSIDGLIDTVLAPRAIEMEYKWFEISGNSEESEDVIQDLLGRRGLQTWTQRVYAYERRSSPDTRSTGDPSIRIVPINTTLLSPGGAKNRSAVEKMLLRYWDSVEQFVEQGFGYATVSMQEVTSLCFVSFRAGSDISLAIETFESSASFQKQNLARAVTAETVKHALRLSLKPHWDCTDTNVGAYRTAESLGMTLKHTYKCFGFLL